MRGERRTLRAVLVGLVALIALAFAASASADTYVVLYKGSSLPASAKADVTKAGGTWIYGYDEIGVAIARSDSASFATTLGKDNRVEGVSSTAGFASRVSPVQSSASEGDLPNAPATDADSLSPLQWDMRQIHTPQAHAIKGGSPVVVVGDID